MDEFAVRSQKLAAAAAQSGRLAEEITPGSAENRKGGPSGEFFSADDYVLS